MCRSLARLLDEAEIVLSIVPPGEARAVAADVAAQGGTLRVLFADLKAVAQDHGGDRRRPSRP